MNLLRGCLFPVERQNARKKNIVILLTFLKFIGEEENEIKVEASAFKTSVAERDDILPPKVTSETETIQEGVTKHLIKEGYGENPMKGSTCFSKFSLSFSFIMSDYSI